MTSQNPEVIVGITALQKFLNKRGYAALDSVQTAYATAVSRIHC